MYIYICTLISIPSSASQGTQAATYTPSCILLEMSWVLESQHVLVEGLELFAGSDDQGKGTGQHQTLSSSRCGSECYVPWLR